MWETSRKECRILQAACTDCLADLCQILYVCLDSAFSTMRL